tara:strand:- start:292 stop:978 length:687 start_codon:yes stop_codon:yes gene_type:complete
MKNLFLVIIISLFSFNSFSQEYVWSVYNIKVDRVNAGQVVSAMDNYLSQPGNLVDGVTVSLFEIMFASDDNEATHVIAFTGNPDAMNAMYSAGQNDQWQVMMNTFDQLTESKGSAAGRSIHTFNVEGEGPIHHILQLKVDEPDKYAPAFKKMWTTVKPDNRLTLGQFVSGRADGVSHYILVSNNDFKDLVTQRDWNAKERAAWQTYRKERGDMEIISTMTRALVKQWK